MRKIAASLAFALFATASFAQTPMPAEKLLESAKVVAASSNKNVMVVFHASWCGWCKKFEAFINEPKFKPLFLNSYEIVRLDILENPDKKNLENEGGEDIFNNLGGKGGGIPFFAVMSPKGKVLVTSNREDKTKKKGVNIGHPAAPEEIAHFMDVLRKTSKMSEKERAEIETWLKAQKLG